MKTVETAEVNVLEKRSRTIVSILTNDAHIVNIRTFVVAARYLSFKAAARFLCLTPGAVSHRIANLEDSLGFPLFNRLTRGISLTTEGEHIMHVCMEAFTRFRDEINTRISQEHFSRLTIYSHQSIAISWLIPRLALFHSLHPTVQMHLQTGNALVSFESNSRVDMAIYYANSHFTGLCSEQFMDEEIFPVCSPCYAAEHNLADDPDKLQDCTLLHDAAAWHFSSPAAEWQEWFQEKGITITLGRSAVSFDTSYAAVAAASTHLGVAMGRRRVVQSLLDEGKLIQPFPALPAVQSGFGYYGVWPRSLCRQPALDLFLEWLKETGAAS